ncbi:MAG: hypothetical protein WB697_12720 [Stellaceae bacterium]
MTELNITTGRCLCGAIRYEFRGAPEWVVHCHCDSCRSASVLGHEQIR